MKRKDFNKKQNNNYKKQKNYGPNAPYRLNLQQGENKRPVAFKETRKINHDGEKVMAHAMDYVHYLKVLIRISNMAGSEFGKEIRNEIDTGEPSDVSMSAIAPKAWCEADVSIGPYPTEREFKQKYRETPRLNAPLTAEEKELLTRLQKDYDENKKIKQKEWTGIRNLYLENRGKCITKILTDCTSETMRLALRNRHDYSEATNADSVADFINWYTYAIKQTVGFDDSNKEKLEIETLLSSESDHLKIAQLSGPQDYILCVKSLLTVYKKLLLNDRIAYNEEELQNMTEEKKNEEINRMTQNIDYEVDRNGLFKRTIFKELRDAGNTPSNAIIRAVKVLQDKDGKSIDTPPYDTISEMLEVMTDLANTALLENIEGIKVYQQTRNEEKAMERENAIINNQMMDKGDRNKKECKYCLEVLGREQNSKNHYWRDCFYNKKSSKFIGEDRKKAAEDRVGANKGKKKLSINAMIRRLYKQATDQKPEGRQD